MEWKTAQGCVLIVEDPLIRRFVGGILTREGRSVVEAEPDQALRILRGGECAVSLLVTNHPERFLEFAETLPLLYIAAFPDAALAVCFPRYRMLRKPFYPPDLVRCAAELLRVPAV